MPRQPVVNTILGAVITLASLGNKVFGWFRGIEYLRTTYPALYGFLTSPAFEYTLMLLGLALAATGVYGVFKARDESARSVVPVAALPVAAKSTGNTASVSRAIAAGGDVHYHEAAMEPAPKIGHPTPVLTTKQKDRPNLTYCGFRYADVFVSKWEHGGIAEPTNGQEHAAANHALVLKFENEPWSDGLGARSSDLIARIVYGLGHGSPVRIDFAVWLNARSRYYGIGLGETHELLIALRRSDKEEWQSEKQSFVVFEDSLAVPERHPSRVFVRN